MLFDIRVQFRKGFRLRVIILTLQNKDIRHGILLLPSEKVKYQTDNERAEHGKRNHASASIIPTTIDQNRNAISSGSLIAVRKRTMDSAPTIPTTLEVTVNDSKSGYYTLQS